MLEATPSTPLIEGLIVLSRILVVCLSRDPITLRRTLDGPIMIALNPVLGIGRRNRLEAPTLVVLPNTPTSLGRPKNPVKCACVWQLAFLGVSLTVAAALLNAEVYVLKRASRPRRRASHRKQCTRAHTLATEPSTGAFAVKTMLCLLAILLRQ